MQIYTHTCMWFTCTHSMIGPHGPIVSWDVSKVTDIIVIGCAIQITYDIKYLR